MLKEPVVNKKKNINSIFKLQYLYKGLLVICLLFGVSYAFFQFRQDIVTKPEVIAGSVYFNCLLFIHADLCHISPSALLSSLLL